MSLPGMNPVETQMNVIMDAVRKVEWKKDVLNPEQRDALRTARDSIEFAIQSISKGQSNDAIADLTFAHSKISDLLKFS